ncbi:hypothetical protein BaRGS_00024420, partial [Batillaria attramentaria]
MLVYLRAKYYEFVNKIRGVDSVQTKGYRRLSDATAPPPGEIWYCRLVNFPDSIAPG